MRERERERVRVCLNAEVREAQEMKVLPKFRDVAQEKNIVWVTFFAPGPRPELGSGIIPGKWANQVMFVVVVVVVIVIVFVESSSSSLLLSALSLSS